VVQELEFFTSEFCVQDPQLTDARIYGIPLAMQGDGTDGIGAEVGLIQWLLELVNQGWFNSKSASLEKLASALGNLGRQNICQNDISLQNGGFNMV